MGGVGILCRFGNLSRASGLGDPGFRVWGLRFRV